MNLRTRCVNQLQWYEPRGYVEKETQTEPSAGPSQAFLTESSTSSTCSLIDLTIYSGSTLAGNKSTVGTSLSVGVRINTGYRHRHPHRHQQRSWKSTTLRKRQTQQQQQQKRQLQLRYQRASLLLSLIFSA